MKDKHEKAEGRGCQAQRSFYKDLAICGILSLFPEYVIRWRFRIFLRQAGKSANIFWAWRHWLLYQEEGAWSCIEI